MAESTQTVTIEKLVQGGRGLAHLGAQVVFVPGVLPTETVVVSLAPHKDFQEATVRQVLTASPDRVIPPCSVYDICGGCQFQHVGYDAQLRYKAAILVETLQRIGHLEVAHMPAIIPSPSPYGYRSGLRFVVYRAAPGFTLGFHKQRSKEVVPAVGCRLIPDTLRRAVEAISAKLSSASRLPVRVDELELRGSLAFGSLLLSWKTGPAGLEQVQRFCGLFQDLPDLAGQVVSTKTGARWVFGQEWIADRLDGLLFRISDRSFMQSHWKLNQTLTRTIIDWVEPAQTTRVLELFAGIGTIGLPLARQGALVTEVEANQYALADCRQAAKINHIGRSRFRHLLAEAMLKGTADGEYDVIIVDPPRAGLTAESVQELIRLEADRLLYLSCDAPTLARDLSRLCAGGYKIRRLQAFDMFPQTAHLETLVEMGR